MEGGAEPSALSEESLLLWKCPSDPCRPAGLPPARTLSREPPPPALQSPRQGWWQESVFSSLKFGHAGFRSSKTLPEDSVPRGIPAPREDGKPSQSGRRADSGSPSLQGSDREQTALLSTLSFPRKP